MSVYIPAGKDNVENRGQNGFSPTAAKNNSVPLRVSLQTAITTPNPSLIRRGTRFFS
jgi:hypothetical protein